VAEVVVALMLTNLLVVLAVAVLVTVQMDHTEMELLELLIQAVVEVVLQAVVHLMVLAVLVVRVL
jgi:hypothetical protein